MEAKHRSLLVYSRHFPDPKNADEATALVAQYQAHGFDVYVSERGQIEVRAPRRVEPIRAFVMNPKGRDGKLIKACQRTNSTGKLNDHRGKSSISGTFRYDDALWVNIGSSGVGGENCERVAPEAEYNGPIPVHDYDGDPWLAVRYVGYAGLRVFWRKQPYVITGERLYLYDAPPTEPSHSAPDPSGDQAISLPSKGMCPTTR